MKVLVSGAAGPVGYSLCADLSDNGFTVTVPESDVVRGGLVGLPLELAAGGTDPESLVGALSGVQAVFDCGFADPVWPPADNSSALEATGNLLVAMSRTGVVELVHVGTAFSFGPEEGAEPADEDSPYSPDRFHLRCLEVARRAQDTTLRYNEAGKLRCVVVNLTVPLGGRGTASSIGAALVDRVRRCEGDCPSGGINVVGAADAARGVVRALGRGKAGRCYILGGHNATYRELFDGIAGCLGVAPPSETVGGAPEQPRSRIASAVARLRGGALAPGEAAAALASQYLYYSNRRAVSELGFEPGNLAAMLEEACSAYLNG